MSCTESKAYKFSQYNVCFSKCGKSYLWNTFTGFLAKLDEDGQSYLSRFSGVDDGSDYFSVLKENGCIVDARHDELGQVLCEEKQTMLDAAPSAMHFTIATGLDCNYNCPYCFEKGARSHHVMTPAKADEVFDFVRGLMEGNPNLERVGVTWFGGEPLLHTEMIRYLSMRLVAYCEERGLAYGAGIVTNGRLLTREVASLLVSCGVSYVQLSMDGMSETYTKSKGAKRGDFDATVANIVESADVIPITVRINVESSLDEALELVDYLLIKRRLQGRVKVYMAHVRGYGANVDAAQERDSHSAFLGMSSDFLGHFGACGDYAVGDCAAIAPRRRRTTCLSCCSSNYCIGPLGELYRCEHHFGRKDYEVGNVSGELFYPAHETGIWNFKHREQCLSCKVFPICLGGCMYDAMEHGNMLACDKMEDHFIDLLMFDVERQRHKTEQSCVEGR